MPLFRWARIPAHPTSAPRAAVSLLMSMPRVRTEEESSAPSELQAGECAQPAEPAAMSLSEAVQAVRAERDMLLVRRSKRETGRFPSTR